MKYNILIAVLLSLLAEIVFGKDIPLPISMLGDGYDGKLLYLRRSDDDDTFTPFTCTRAKNGHYYYPVKINYQEVKLGITSWSAKTAVIGDDCRLACEVPYQLKHPGAI